MEQIFQSLVFNSSQSSSSNLLSSAAIADLNNRPLKTDSQLTSSSNYWPTKSSPQLVLMSKSKPSPAKISPLLKLVQNNLLTSSNISDNGLPVACNLLAPTSESAANSKLELSPIGQDQKRSIIKFLPDGIKLRFTNPQTGQENQLLSLKLKQNNNRQFTGISLQSNPQLDANSTEPSTNPITRKAGLIANLSGAIRGQLAGHLEDSPAGFQAHLDFNLETDDPSNNPVQCQWSTYDQEVKYQSSTSNKKTRKTKRRPATTLNIQTEFNPSISESNLENSDQDLISISAPFDSDLIFSEFNLESPGQQRAEKKKSTNRLLIVEDPSLNNHDAKSANQPEVQNIFSMLFDPPSSKERSTEHNLSLTELLASVAQENIDESTNDDPDDEIIFEKRCQLTNCENKVIYNNDLISGIYYDNLDLPRIDSLIRDKLRKEYESLPKLEQLLQELIASNLSQQSKSIDNKIVYLTSQITQIKNDEHIKAYNNSSQEYLKLYQYVNSTDNEQDFNLTRLKIIIEYLEIARHYIGINLIHVENSLTNCQICGSDLSDIYPDEQGIIECPSCQVETRQLQISPTQQDNFPGSKPNKGNYIDLETFLKAIDCYVGAQRVNFPEYLERDLDEYFNSIDRPIGREIRATDLYGNFKGRRKRGLMPVIVPDGRTIMLPMATREIMYDSLSKTGHSKHYENINVICHFYWGWELPNIAHLKDLLIKDYKFTQPIFNQLKGPRKSSLGSEYRLFRQLWHRGHPCHPADFKIVVTEGILAYYEDKWESLCQFEVEEGKTLVQHLGWRPFVRIEVLYRMDPDTLEEAEVFT